MSTAPIRIVPQGEILASAGEAPFVKLPALVSHFADRARRFESLAAKGHADAAFLLTMARLAQAQQAALEVYPAVGAPTEAHLALCHRHALPPLAKDGPRDGLWREILPGMIASMMEAVPGPARDALARLQAMEAARLEENADRLLSFDYPEVDPAQAPFLAAALQVDWVARVNACGANAFKKLEMAGLCPACGSPPVSSVIRIDVPVPGTRYLACALCGTSWRMGRGQCTQCDAQEKLAYYHLEGGDEVVKAEACEACHGYVKILNHEKDPQADPVADDLATLALDVLMDDSDFARASPNLFFVPGQG